MKLTAGDDFEDYTEGGGDEADTNSVEDPASDTEDQTVRRIGQSGFVPALPSGFAQSLQRLVRHTQAQTAEVFRTFDSMRAFSERVEKQHKDMLRSFVRPQQVLNDFARSIDPFVKSLSALPRKLLPPNLRDVSDDVTASDVLNFLEEEGIPLYLVPRAVIGRRLILAKDHASRRKILNDRFEQITDDCATLLDTCTDPIVSTEVHFIKDGIAALRAGCYASAQAIFTVTLDTLITRFYPDQKERRKITNRKKGAQPPDKISDMGVRQAYVWLPIWNAHEEFWQHKGDPVPNDYSRHATVHAVSKRQFSKRNCLQSLMLASSLVGYADQLARRRRQQQ